MFNSFNMLPALLSYGPFFSPAIIRILAAILFFMIARRVSRESNEIVKTDIPLLGKPASWMVGLAVIVTAAVALALFVGFQTQIAAILGMLLALKHMLLGKKYAHLLPFPRTTYLILFFLCASLVISGAGAFAFDLPL